MRSHVLNAALLALFWLLLANELSAGQMVLGLVLGAAVLTLTARFSASHLPIRSYRAASQLAAVFLYDLIVANLAVARAALALRVTIHPRFVRVPLDIREPGPAALLAAMVTLTPGTVSVDLDLTEQMLTVHGLLVGDEARAAAQIKTRYETRIKEIFQC